MKSIFSDTKSLLFCGVAGTALFSINFIPAQILTSIGGGAAIGAIWGGLTAPFILVMAALITRKFGAVTMTYFTYSIFAIPTFVMGPPHIYKPLIALAVGLVFDLILRISGDMDKKGLIAGFTGFTIVSLFMYLQAFRILNLPGLESLEKSIYILGLVFWIEGLIGLFIALKAFQNIKEIPVIKSFQND